MYFHSVQKIRTKNRNIGKEIIVRYKDRILISKGYFRILANIQGLGHIVSKKNDRITMQTKRSVMNFVQFISKRHQSEHRGIGAARRRSAVRIYGSKSDRFQSLRWGSELVGG